MVQDTRVDADKWQLTLKPHTHKKNYSILKAKSASMRSESSAAAGLLSSSLGKLNTVVV